MEESMWNIHNSHYHPPPYMKEEPIAGDMSASQHLWERDDGINVPVVEPVVEIKTGSDYIDSTNGGIICEPHDQGGGRLNYPYHPIVTSNYNKGALNLMAYHDRNRYRENGVSGYSQHKPYPLVHPQPIDISKYEAHHRGLEITRYDPHKGRPEEPSFPKTGPLMFSHSILEPETSETHPNVMSISDVAPPSPPKCGGGGNENNTNYSPSEMDDSTGQYYDERNRSPCAFCGGMFTHVIAHMMTAHSDVPLVAEAMSHEKGSPQRRALFIALKNRGTVIQNNYTEEEEEEKMAETKVEEKTPEDTPQKVACKYCNRRYKAHKIRYHYMKCSAYKESTNHNTFTFRREMRKQDHHKKYMDIIQAFPFVNEKVASEILSRMRQDKITTHILSDPLLLRYAEVHSRGNINQSLLLKVRQDLRNMGKLILSLREKDENVQTMSDVLKPATFGAVVRCVQEQSGYNSATCSYERTSTPTNTGYILRKCTELLKEEAIKSMDDAVIQQCNEFNDLMINDWKGCLSIDAARTKKRQKLPLLQDIKILQLYFDREMTVLVKKLQETKAAMQWRRLSRLTLASIVLFNRGSSRKIDRMTVEDFENRCSPDTLLPELQDKLSESEKQSVCSLTKIDIIETPGKIIPILLKPIHFQAITLLNELRSTVGVVDNPYIFARPGGETPLRGDVIREFAHRAGLEQPNNITPSNLRKHVIITNHLATFPQTGDNTKRRSQTDNAGDSAYDTEGNYGYTHYESQQRSEDGNHDMADADRVLEANGVKLENDDTEVLDKKFNLRECGNRYWFFEYNSSDLEFESGDDSDYEPSKRSKGKAVKARKLDMRKEARLMKAAQAAEDSSSPFANNIRLYVRGKTRYTYCKWTEEEEGIVYEHLGHHFRTGTLPGKKECLQVMTQYEILQKRKWEDVKNFVRNKLVKLERTNSALENSVREFCSTEGLAALQTSVQEFCSAEEAALQNSVREFCSADEADIQNPVPEFQGTDESSLPNPVHNYRDAEEADMQNSAQEFHSSNESAMQMPVNQFHGTNESELQNSVGEYDSNEETALQKSSHDFHSTQQRPMQISVRQFHNDEETDLPKPPHEFHGTQERVMQNSVQEFHGPEQSALHSSMHGFRSSEETVLQSPVQDFHSSGDREMSSSNS